MAEALPERRHTHTLLPMRGSKEALNGIVILVQLDPLTFLKRHQKVSNLRKVRKNCDPAPDSF
jgi:hypothetical protein